MSVGTTICPLSMATPQAAQHFSAEGDQRFGRYEMEQFTKIINMVIVTISPSVGMLFFHEMG
jgi:hypothetical protein